MKTLSRTVFAAVVVAVSMLMVGCDPPPSDVPATTTQGPITTLPPQGATCMHNPTTLADISYTGYFYTGTPGIGTDNLVNHTSSNGTCTGLDPWRPYNTGVIAGDRAAARSMCRAVLGGVRPDFVYNFVANGWSGPQDLWLCGFDSWSRSPAVCMDHPNLPDVYFTGQRDRVGNIKWTATTDGSCSNLTGMTETAVYAPYRRAAVARCADLFGFEPDHVFSYRWEGGYSNAPTDLWLCVQMT